MKIYLNDRLTLTGEDWIPESEIEFNENMKNLLETLDSYNYMPEALIFYSGAGLDLFFRNINVTEELLDYSITNPIHKLRMILSEIDASNWNNNKLQVEDHSYYFISNGGTLTTYINNTTIAEAFENTLGQENVGLINLTSSQFNETNPLNVFKRNINPPNNIIFGYVDFISSRNEAIGHYHRNRRGRVYNWNRKHGDINRNVIPNKGEVVSRLECTIEEATVLLESALGYRKSNELYVFDEQRRKYMVFKCDPSDNSFHSYHPIDQDEVHVDVKTFLNAIIQ
jgi:hypothetical protein